MVSGVGTLCGGTNGRYRPEPMSVDPTPRLDGVVSCSAAALAPIAACETFLIDG